MQQVQVGAAGGLSCSDLWRLTEQVLPIHEAGGQGAEQAPFSQISDAPQIQKPLPEGTPMRKATPGHATVSMLIPRATDRMSLKKGSTQSESLETGPQAHLSPVSEDAWGPGSHLLGRWLCNWVNTLGRCRALTSVPSGQATWKSLQFQLPCPRRQ